MSHWFYGPHAELPSVIVLFRSYFRPTKESHGHLVLFAWGPYVNREDAIKGARFQHIYISQFFNAHNEPINLSDDL